MQPRTKASTFILTIVRKEAVEHAQRRSTLSLREIGLTAAEECQSASRQPRERPLAPAVSFNASERLSSGLSGSSVDLVQCGQQSGLHLHCRLEALDGLRRHEPSITSDSSEDTEGHNSATRVDLSDKTFLRMRLGLEPENGRQPVVR